MSIDHVRAGRRSKRRGERGELEVRDLLREHGWATAHRQFQSGGQGGGDLADAIPDFHLEVKYTERLNLPSAWRQANWSSRPTDTVVVVHRANGQPWMGTLLLTDWLDLAPRGLRVSAKVISDRASVRSEFMSLVRACTAGVQPLLVHPLDRGAFAMVTVLFEELIGLVRND